ncbi:hypothetical protein MAR_000259, partial [Mya arenaria]
ENSFVPKKPIWDDAVKDIFIECFDNNVISDLKQELDVMYLEKSYSNDTINSFTGKVSDLITNAADSCSLFLSMKTKNSNKKSQNRKPWFDKDCKNARKQYHASRNKYRLPRSQDTYKDMVGRSRSYKKGLRSTDPKSYWNFLNRYSGERKDTMSKISSEVFYEHFVKLNQSVNTDDNSFNDIDVDSLP